MLRKQIFASGEPQSFESRMVKFDGTPFWAQLDVATVHVEDGTSAPVSYTHLDVYKRQLSWSPLSCGRQG